MHNTHVLERSPIGRKQVAPISTRHFFPAFQAQIPLCGVEVFALFSTVMSKRFNNLYKPNMRLPEKSSNFKAKQFSDINVMFSLDVCVYW